MDENNNNSQKESINQNTADSHEKITDSAAKPVSAFDMPTERKTYAAPDNTQYANYDTSSSYNDNASNTASETTSYSPSSTVSETASYNPSSTVSETASYSSSNTVPEEIPLGFGIASLVLGIFSIITSCCCGLGLIASILGIIFGCVQPKDYSGKKPGIAIAGIITSCVGILFSIFGIAYIILVGSIS